MIYEFYAPINNGVIKVPNDYKNKIGKKVKVTLSDEENPIIAALNKFQKAMEGEAEKAGFYNEDDVADLIMEMRRKDAKKNI